MLLHENQKGKILFGSLLASSLLPSTKHNGQDEDVVVQKGNSEAYAGSLTVHQSHCVL